MSATHIGYRVVSFSLKELQAKTLMNRLPVDLQRGSTLSNSDGIFLGTSEDFCEYYVGGTDDHDLILSYEYDEKDILKGEVSPGSEILVKEARLVDVCFHDDFMQEYYGYLIDQSSNSRNKEKGMPLDSGHQKKVFLIRTMPEQCDVLLPMDYAYLLDGRISDSTIKRVLNDYEEGERPMANRSRILMKTLEHAVTSAIYQGNPYRIVVSSVPANQVFHATNTGEFFYAGDEPAETETIMMVDSEGQPSAVKKPENKWEMTGP